MESPDINPHEYYMDLCIQLAKSNPKAPFAAMIIDADTGDILSQGINNSGQNPILHGEIDAINNFVQTHPIGSFTNTILYTTAEPCPMCMGGIIWAKIPLTVFGTSIATLSNFGWNQIHLQSQEVVDNSISFYSGKIIGGILSEKTDELFKRNLRI